MRVEAICNASPVAKCMILSLLAKLFKNSKDNDCAYDEANETTDIDAKKTQEVLLNGAMSIADKKKKEGKEEAKGEEKKEEVSL